MNEQIISNLFELWEQIGKITNKLIKTEQYASVSMENSDWPNRVFNLQNDTDIITDVIRLSNEEKVANKIAVPKSYNWRNNPELQFLMSQKNMAVETGSIQKVFAHNRHIRRVKTENDAVCFAKIASESFGYKVDSFVVNEIIKHTEKIRLFIHQEENEYLACGLLFFDSDNNAGFHMIGTVPVGRGKGIGRSMTENLLQEAKNNKAKYCVLHASPMGEPIYTKLGFKTFGEIETYSILKKQNS